LESRSPELCPRKSFDPDHTKLHRVIPVVKAEYGWQVPSEEREVCVNIVCVRTASFITDTTEWY